MSQPDDKHVRKGPGLEVARCGARSTGKVLRFVISHRQASCPQCKVADMTGNNRMIAADRARRIAWRSLPPPVQR